jgi:hypothetical protein
VDQNETAMDKAETIPYSGILTVFSLRDSLPRRITPLHGLQVHVASYQQLTRLHQPKKHDDASGSPTTSEAVCRLSADPETQANVSEASSTYQVVVRPLRLYTNVLAL